MKFLLSLTVLGIFCANNVNAYISSTPPGGAVPWKNDAKTSFAQPPANVDLDDIFREEYQAWAKHYGKSTSDSTRFENFKLNYMLQMQHNKKTGTFNHLNEFGDMTANEFESGQMYEEKSDRTEVTAKDSNDNVVEVELVDLEPVPRVRKMDSETIPRVTPFGSPTAHRSPTTSPHYASEDYAYKRSQQRQRASRRAQKVPFTNVNASPPKQGYTAFRHHTKPAAYGNHHTNPTGYGNQGYYQRDPSGPRVYRQDQNQPPKPRRSRRFVRVGADKIL